MSTNLMVERFGKALFSNGFTPDNLYRLVKALERIADELAEMNLSGLKTRTYGH